MKALIGIMAAVQVHEQERKGHLDRKATNSMQHPAGDKDWRRIERTLIFS
jgi:hypothetical protein